MRFLGIDFAFNEKDSPGCHIWQSKDVHTTNTIFVNFFSEEEGNTSPRISLFLHDEQGLINFKNKVQWAFDDLMRRKKER